MAPESGQGRIRGWTSAEATQRPASVSKARFYLLVSAGHPDCPQPQTLATEIQGAREGGDSR